jgi:hypothetical protein
MSDTDKPIPDYTPQEFWDKRVEHDPDQNEFWQIFFYIDEYAKAIDIYVSEAYIRGNGMFSQILDEEFSDEYQNLIDIKDHIKLNDTKGFLYEDNSILDWGFMDYNRIVPDTTFRDCYVPTGLTIFSEMQFCYSYKGFDGVDIVKQDKRFDFVNTHGELTKDIPLFGYNTQMSKILFNGQTFEEILQIEWDIVSESSPVIYEYLPLSPDLKIQNGNLYNSYRIYNSHYHIEIKPDFNCQLPTIWDFRNTFNGFYYMTSPPNHSVFYATDFDISSSLELISATYYHYSCVGTSPNCTCYGYDIEYTLNFNKQGHYSVISKNTPFNHSKFADLILHHDINYKEESLPIQPEQIYRHFPTTSIYDEDISLEFDVTQVTEHSLFNQTFTSNMHIIDKEFGFDNDPPLHPNIHEYYYKYTAGSGEKIYYSGVPIRFSSLTQLQDGAIEWTI